MSVPYVSTSLFCTFSAHQFSVSLYSICVLLCWQNKGVGIDYQRRLLPVVLLSSVCIVTQRVLKCRRHRMTPQTWFWEEYDQQTKRWSLQSNLSILLFSEGDFLWRRHAAFPSRIWPAARKKALPQPSNTSWYYISWRRDIGLLLTSLSLNSLVKADSWAMKKIINPDWIFRDAFQSKQTA
jgi:hypothetical protein